MELQFFQFDEKNNIRTLTKGDQIWFVAKDVLVLLQEIKRLIKTKQLNIFFIFKILSGKYLYF